VRYAEVWHLLVTAEDRCRAERFPRLTRYLHNRFTKGQEPDYDPATPWDMVFRYAAKDRGFWDEHVRDPALRFLAMRGNKGKTQIGGTDSRTDIANVEPPWTPVLAGEESYPCPPHFGKGCG